MYPFFESIAFVNGVPRNLFFHQARIDKTFRAHYPGKDSLHLEYLLSKLEPLSAPLVKCRFSYNEEHFKILQLPYLAKSYSSFILITDDHISYQYKYTDRSWVKRLQENIDPDQQFILVKSNLLTDTAISNLLFFDGFKWVTPASPLLPGTMRASLLAELKIFEADITVNQLKYFQSFKLINALNTLETSIEYPIELIQKRTLIK